MTAYYNEIDPKAAAWLRELIADGVIAPGEVDERDIRDVAPDDLRPFRQCHFFAGIGGWSLALRRAGWEDERPAWTASCPCQPFSAAGGRGGFADERHLWPAFYHLAEQRRPAVVLGEQVASKDGLAWLDLVSSDMEAAGYAGGALDLCSAGFGAPNIRQRLYFVWMADAADVGHERAREPRGRGARLEDDGAAFRVADARSEGRQLECQKPRGGPERSEQPAPRRPYLSGRGGPSGMAHAGRSRSSQLGGGREQSPRPAETSDPLWPGPLNGFWRDADWIGCTDGKWRAVEPGSFPLASGIPGRVALLRGAGNAINVEVARGFIEEVMVLMESGRLLAA